MNVLLAAQRFLSLHQRRARLSVGLVVGLLVALLPGVSPVSAVQQNEIVLGVEFDGLQPNGEPDSAYQGLTDGSHTPGYDENQNNNVVLTNDIIGYRIDWNVNEVDGTVVAVTATLPEGMSWVTDPGTAFGAPVGCVDDGSSTIDGNSGRDLYCVLDAEHEGSNGVIRPQANVGSQFDATSLQLQAFIESGESGTVGSNTVETFASARPKADWVKGKDVLTGDPAVVTSQQLAEEIQGVTDPDTGEVGRIWLYPLRLLPVGGVVGAEKMDDSQDILIFDHAYQMPPNAKLATGLVPDGPSGNARTACGAYDGVEGYPVGSAGTWTCALDAAATAANGYPVVQIDISGHDTSALPPLNGDGTPNTSTMMAGQIAFFVPESDFPSGAFNMDINNGISGTTDPVTLPTDLDPIQVWGSTPTSFDEAGVVNNYAYWNAQAVPITGSPGRVFRHTVQYTEGPYQELSRQTPDGRDYRTADTRAKTRGGLGISVTNTVKDGGIFGWGHGNTGPMSQLTPRGNELVLTAELDHTQTAPANPYFYEASSLCVGIDPTHQSIMALPSSFDVNHLEATAHPYAWAYAIHDATTQESSNTGALAQVHIGSHPNYSNHVFSLTHGVETTLIDVPYVVEFAAATTPVDQDVAINGVTCNNADADGRGWVDAEGDLSVFDSVTPGDGVYEDITNVRLRVTGPMSWRGSPLHPLGIDAWGTAINLNVQVKVKADPTANAADQELFAYASRAYTPSPLPHTPEEVVVWDPETMATPGTPSCTNNTLGVWKDRFGDGVNHNEIIPSGWCNVPFEDDGSSSVDLADNPHDFGGGGENAYEITANSASSYTGTYPRMVHADKVTIVEAELGIGKTNLAGPNDVNTNGDSIEFEVRPAIVGSSLDTLSDVVVTDTLPAQYEFVGFTQLPVTSTNTNATVPPNNDGTALASPVCSVSGQTISCDFGTQTGGWSDSFRYEVVLKDSTANATYTNTARIVGNDALSGDPKTPKTATAKSFTPDVFDESGIIKFVDRHIGSCPTFPAGAGVEPADWAEDCSTIAADGNIRYTLDVENEGLSALDNYRVIDVLPHLGDEVEIASNTLTGDGRTPESDFSGTIELLAAAGPGTTFYYSADDPNTITRDPDLSETINTWCTAPAAGTAVFGAGTCPASLADVTAVYADLGTLALSETRTLTIDVATFGNECGDTYTNNFGARTDDILLPIRSNDVSAMVGFCEPEVDIEKDTNGVQADNIDEDVDGDGNLDVDEDTNGNGVLDTGEDVDNDGNLDVDEDTNDPNGVLDAAVPAGSNIGPGIPVGGDVTWTYVVTNGDVALINAVVSDSDASVTVDCDIDGDGTFDNTDTIPVLLPNAEITCMATGTAALGQYSNNSTVAGTPVVPTAVDPSIDPDDPSTWPDDPNFDPEDESTWPLDPAIDLSDPSTWPEDPAGYGAPIDPVTGEPMFPETLTDEDPSHYWGVPNEVGVDIEKDTNGVQADNDAGPAIPVGGDVTWTYVVTNSGQLPITPATVADSDPALSVVCEASLADAGGDNIIDIFLPGESVTCTATGTATAGNYENTATVSGPTSLPAESCVCDPEDPATWPTTAEAYSENTDDDGNPITVEDTDDSHYNGAEPGIDIEKDTNGVQSDEAPGENISAGDPVTWTYVVTNTGTTALADATVTDDQGVTVDCDIDGNGSFDGTNVIPFLLPGAAATCEGTGTAVGGPYTNNAMVTGNPIMPSAVDPSINPDDPTTWPDDPNFDPEDESTWPLDPAIDFADPTTWPEDPAAYGALTNPDGTLVDPVTDEDPSSYTGTQQISGTVWDDDNGDGIFDSNEATHAGVLVELLDADGNPVLDADGNPITALTDANGNFVFDVPPGDYQLRFTPPAGVEMTTPDIISVTVEPGVDVPNLNAGLNTQPAASTATPTPVAKRTLAFTGTTTFTLLAVAVLFISLGAGFMVVTRRRSHAH